MSRVVHRTPGLIPLESFTVFGMSAKPDSTNPIGKFGTGLKIAIAVLLRHGVEVTIHRGQEQYVFYTQKADFRGKSFAFVRMKRRNSLLGRWTYSKLPFTTELGKHWELWMAFRELHSNTLDENGETFTPVVELRPGKMHANSEPDAPLIECTDIVVEGAAYLDCWHDRARVFLSDGLKLRTDEADVQVLDRASKYLYYRGLRVLDLKEEAQFTYNILREMDLTEDRTLKYASQAEAVVAKYMQQSQDSAYLQRAVAAPRAASFESSLNHQNTSLWYPGRIISKPFLAAAERSPNIGAKKLFQDSQPQVKTKTMLSIEVPKPLLGDAELGALCKLMDSWIMGTKVRDEEGALLPKGDDILF